MAQRADARSRIGSPKSATSRRTVPLGETAARALKEWRLAQPPGRALVFGTAADRPDALGNLTRRLLRPLEALAGIPGYGLHALPALLHQQLAGGRDRPEDGAALGRPQQLWS